MRVAAFCLAAAPLHAHAWDDSSVTATEAQPAAQPALAAATTAGSEPASDALRRYELGREHYLAGRYREALTELKAALELDPSSLNLTYNVARVNEDLGNLDEAISYYQDYLALLPQSDRKERGKTDKTLRRLQGAREEVAAERSASALKGFGPAPAPEPKPSFGRMDVWFWTAAVGGVGLAAAGGVAGLLALQRKDDVAAFVVGPDGSFATRKALGEQADNYALTADVCFLAGGVALTGAALLFFLRAPEDDAETDDEQAKVAVELHARGAMLHVHGAF